MTISNESPSSSSNLVRPEVLEILRCPITRSRLRQEGDFLIAEVGGLSYPVRDGIPVMLPEEAKLPAGFASLEDFRQRFGVS
jgi:uncharacterized protein YbaR (Trm112 family)